MFFGSTGSRKAEWLLCGLGNPGIKYQNTRHNAGFMAVDAIAALCGVAMRATKFRGKFATTQLEGRTVALLKPETFMNESGVAVHACTQFYKIPPERVVVFVDEIVLAPGVLRIRRQGSAGGHNGIKSVIAHLGTQAFLRVKIGVGAKPHPDADLIAWVLSEFLPSERPPLQAGLEQCPAVAKLLVQGDVETAMNRFSH